MLKSKHTRCLKIITASVLGIALLSAAQAGAPLKLGKTVSSADVWEMPTQVTFNIFDAREAQTPIVSQSFEQGEWSSTGDLIEGKNLHISALVTALEDDQADGPLWFDTEVDGVVVGVREAVVRALPAGSISAAGGFVLPDDNYVIKSQADLGGGSATSTDWGDITGKPPGFADNVDNIGDVWNEITGMPAGFADGVDNQGVTKEVDPEVGVNASSKVPRWVVSKLTKVGALVEGTIYDNGSKIGIGTTSLTGLLNLGTAPKLGGIGGTDCSLTGGGYLVAGNTTGASTCVDNNDIIARNNGAVSTLYFQRLGGATQFNGNVDVRDSDSNPSLLLQPDGVNSSGRLKMYAVDGSTVNVDIGALDVVSGGGYINLYRTNGTSGVYLDSNNTDGGGGLYLRNSAGNSYSGVILRANEAAGNGAELRLYDADGNLDINLDADWGTSGKARVDIVGDLYTSKLHITGGADFSEQFSIDKKEYKIKPGMVVSIDPMNPGKLQISTEPYDSKVAGIISGAGGVDTGLMMGQAGTLADGEHPVALTGRVYTWVDASQDAIEPGDMLTSSNTPGYAMKVTEHGKSAGAVIGKAMTPLAKGEEGLVLVLVSLQ